jgi:hypothetical protein
MQIVCLMRRLGYRSTLIPEALLVDAWKVTRRQRDTSESGSKQSIFLLALQSRKMDRFIAPRFRADDFGGSQ